MMLSCDLGKRTDTPCAKTGTDHCRPVYGGTEEPVKDTYTLIFLDIPLTMLGLTIVMALYKIAKLYPCILLDLKLDPPVDASPLMLLLQAYAVTCVVSWYLPTVLFKTLT